MKQFQIAIVLTYNADKVTMEEALKDADEVRADIQFGHYEYYPNYSAEPFLKV